MNDVEADSETICEIGCKFFVSMYGGKKNDSLNNHRYVKYMEMVHIIEPHKLPPTERQLFFMVCVYISKWWYGRALQYAYPQLNGAGKQRTLCYNQLW